MTDKEFQLDPDEREWEYDGYGAKRKRALFHELYIEEPVESKDD